MSKQLVFGALLDSVRGIRWPARRRVRTGLPGAHQSKLRGISAEFTEYRPYRQGDELKRIDWKLFARSDRAFIRLSVERAILPTTIVIDGSASMKFPTKSEAKWDLATHIGIGLAACAHAGADPIGLVLVENNRVHQLTPRTRRDYVSQMINLITTNPAGGKASMLDGLTAAMRKSTRVVLISDFLGEDTEDLIKDAGQYLVMGREVHAIHIVAAEELDPPRAAALVSDPENPEERRPMVEEARDEYLENFGEWREKLAADFRHMGAQFHMVVTENEPVDHIVRRVCVPAATSETRS
jgi:uncharacterized protein (DUF58 family)